MGEIDRRFVLGFFAAGAFGAACGSRRTSGSPNLPTMPTSALVSTSAGSVASSPARVAPAAQPWAHADFGQLDAFVAASAGSAFIIVEGGTKIHEWYRDSDPTFSRDIASAQKSVLALLVGVAVDRGLLTIDTPVDAILGPDWAKGDSSTITVFHLLTMTSGLDNSVRVAKKPGSGWYYNNAFSPLFDVVAKVGGGTLNEVATDWLFAPIGMTGAEFRQRANPGAATAIGLVCTAAQLATIGALVLGHTDLPVSRSWIDLAHTPSQSFNPAYGLLWWLNGQSSYVVPEGKRFEGALIPSAPSDLVAALGKDDQKLYVSRALDLTVVRLGDNADPTSKLALSGFDDDLWKRIVAERNR
jgi:CubicO group peptidase (beta-lactamase class C family)